MAVGDAPPGVLPAASGGGPESDTRAGGGGGVVLATLGVPFEAEAVDVAVEAAREGQRMLIVANVVALEPLPISLQMGYLEAAMDPDLLAAIRAPAVKAYALGLELERVRIRTPHPVAALLEFVSERAAALLVFGPDRTVLRRRTYRRAARTIRKDAPCLVWLAE
jgi:Universal stress protein family